MQTLHFPEFPSIGLIKNVFYAENGRLDTVQFAMLHFVFHFCMLLLQANKAIKKIQVDLLICYPSI